MPHLLFCPPRIGGDCGLYCLAMATLYYAQQGLTTNDFSKFNPLVLDEVSAIAAELDAVDNEDSFDELLSKTVSFIREHMSQSSCLASVANMLAEQASCFGRDTFFSCYPMMATSAKTKLSIDYFKDYLAKPKVWLDIIMLRQISESLFACPLSSDKEALSSQTAQY